MKNIGCILSSIFFAMIFAIATLTAQAATAKQTSLDSRIFQTYQKIDGRTVAHEENATKIRENLGVISKQIEQLNNEYNDIEEVTEGDAANERMKMRGRLTALSAEYLKNSYMLVDAAAQVISANLSDLAALAEEVRKTGDPRGSIQHLKSRIQETVAAGKSMKRALIELRNWSYKDPRISGRFKSLWRVAKALDGRISIDKARVNGRSKASPVLAQHQRLTSLDRTVDRLSDMYTQVMAEKQSLIDLRDEVAMSIQLGRLEMIQEIGERAIPNLMEPKNPSLGIPSLAKVTDGIIRMNTSFLNEGPATPNPANASTPENTGDLSIDGLKNF